MQKYVCKQKQIYKQEQIMNPQQQPQTPKKVKVFAPQPVNYTKRLKFRYTIIQKPKSSKLSAILIVAWLLLLGMLLLTSYLNKLKIIENQARQQQIQCQADYQKNKCDKGIKAIASYCEQRRRCYEAAPSTHYQNKINTPFIAGEILKTFLEGAGFYVSIAGLFMIWTLIKRQQPKEIKKQYQQFFQ